MVAVPPGRHRHSSVTAQLQVPTLNMSNLYTGPKLKALSTNETFASIESWKANIIYSLRLNKDFQPYLTEGFIFGRKTRAKPSRDLVDDIKTERVNDEDVVTIIKSKEEKAVIVDLMLDQIANWASCIPRNDITRDCRSLNDVWSKIRQFFNKQITGSLLNDVWNVKRQSDETPQALLSRMKQMVDDNLLTTDGLNHVDGKVDEDEELSPTLHNYVVLHWLQVLHPELRDLVTSRFITQLRDNTYASILPEISRSVDSLLEELNNGASACRTFPSQRTSFSQSRPYQQQPGYKSNYQPSRIKKVCEFCKATGKRFFYTHDISTCLFIRKMNSNKPASAKQVEQEDNELEDLQGHYDEFFDCMEDPAPARNVVVEHVLNRINVEASPVLQLEAELEVCDATLDTGATCSIISEEKARKIGAVIQKTNQRVRMADGQSNLEVIGETIVDLFRRNKCFRLSAIVCRNTDTEILAGMPFLKENDIAIRPFTDEIIINNQEYIKYDPYKRSSTITSRRLTVHASKNSVLLPGQSETFSVKGISGEVAVEPRYDTAHNKKINGSSQVWPKPHITKVHNGQISLCNTTTEPVPIRKLEHLFVVHPETKRLPESTVKLASKISSPPPKVPKPIKAANFSDTVVLNPDNVLTKAEEIAFRKLLVTYDPVFSPELVRYNGKSGACHVEVNMGPNLPVQRKGRLPPFYGTDNLVELQEKFDALVEQGVLSRPQDIGVCVENINPSFLVRKQPPSTDKRLVTDFASIAEYCRPTPSLMPNVDVTLRCIACWKYLIKTDLSSAYYQLLLKLSSKKYCGVHTPFKGVFVYNTGVMGLPGVEVALEELTCLLLGDMVKDGRVAKLADDLFIGGNTVQELLENFQLVLQKLLENDIRLSPAKTFIAPASVILLGWLWSSGTLKASSHKLNTLATCPQPVTVSGLKSYIGTYRFLSRVLEGYGSLLAPLENAVKGLNLKDKINWTESLSCAFKKSQEALNDAKTITMPRPSDKLCIVTDASIQPGGIGATLYAVRDGKQRLAGFYNCKLPLYQARWLPCEVEALGIAAALNHWAPMIIQSHERPQVLTDNKPCVDAAKKLVKGEFSASARLSSFLSTVFQYKAEILHIPGTSNLSSDHQSRNPAQCKHPKCSICKFVQDTMTSVVQSVSVEDIVQGRARIPFANRNSWKEVQEQCPDLRKVKDFRSQGTQPRKKSKNMKSVRRYLSSGTLLSHDGVLVNPKSFPMGPVAERIVVPKQVLYGTLSALHLQLKHPTAYQLNEAFSRYFFALDTEKVISEVTKACHICASIRDVPTAMIEESTDAPPEVVGTRLAADIIKRNQQKIFIIRESVTSYTMAEFIEDETVSSVSAALLRQCLLLRPSSSSKVTVRLDPASAHKSMFANLKKGSVLSSHNIFIEIGRELNKNKNPIIDKAIRELHRELLIISPSGGPITSSQLAQGIATLNSRYRSSGMSSHELWTQRDQVTGDQLPINDRQLIIKQYQQRIANHKHSQASKSCGKPPHPEPDVKVGSLVYLYNDRSKLVPRKRYLVTGISGDWVTLRRFTENLLGGKEYKAKLRECYSVPSIEESPLPELNEDSSSDEENLPLNEPPNSSEINNSDGDKSGTASGSDHELYTASEDADTEDSGQDSSEEESEDHHRPGRYTMDPILRTPPNLTPARRNQPQRTRNKPDFYGSFN